VSRRPVPNNVLVDGSNKGVTCIYVSSRSLVQLANNHEAPAWLAHTNDKGVPTKAVMVASAVGSTAYLSLGKRSIEAFMWLVELSSMASLVSWCILCVSYLRLYDGIKRNGISRTGQLLYPFASTSRESD
jgi:amino acid transporter